MPECIMAQEAVRPANKRSLPAVNQVVEPIHISSSLPSIATGKTSIGLLALFVIVGQVCSAWKRR
jgi:hypothetical protein